MDLIALAVPLFLLAIIAELLIDRVRGTRYYRLNDALGSLATGVLHSNFGLFSRVITVGIYALIQQNFAPFVLDMSLFDVSARGLLLWAGALFLWDFCYYWNHRLNHEFSLLWASHVVHHQSEDYNLSTALRQTSTGFVFGWVFYIPMYLLGVPFQVYATVAALDLIYQFWVHTQQIGKLGWADRVFVTPSNHRVHHGRNPEYLDKNYGGILIVWDRVFGTFQEELDDKPVLFGVLKPLKSLNPFWANFQVYAGMARDAWRTAGWRQKLAVIFARTGWRPDDVAAADPVALLGVNDREKYDPPSASGLKYYVFCQFVLMVVLGSVIGVLYTSVPFHVSLMLSGILWLTLLSLMWLVEASPRARKLELARLIVCVPFAALLLGYLLPEARPHHAAIVMAAAGYSALSAMVFLRIWRQSLLPAVPPVPDTAS